MKNWYISHIPLKSGENYLRLLAFFLFIDIYLKKETMKLNENTMLVINDIWNLHESFGINHSFSIYRLVTKLPWYHIEQNTYQNIMNGWNHLSFKKWQLQSHWLWRKNTKCKSHGMKMKRVNREHIFWQLCTYSLK